MTKHSLRRCAALAWMLQVNCRADWSGDAAQSSVIQG